MSTGEVKEVKKEVKESGLEKQKAEFEKLLINVMIKQVGKLHEGISQLSGEAQDMMLRKVSEASTEFAKEMYPRMLGRTIDTLTVDEMMKMAEIMENSASVFYGNGEPVSITRKGNIITWQGCKVCYDPSITKGWVKPYPAYCDWCNKYYFEDIFKIAHKGPVKVKGLKSVIRGDGTCLTQIELL